MLALRLELSVPDLLVDVPWRVEGTFTNVGDQELALHRDSVESGALALRVRVANGPSVHLPPASIPRQRPPILLSPAQAHRQSYSIVPPRRLLAGSYEMQLHHFLGSQAVTSEWQRFTYKPA